MLLLMEEILHQLVYMQAYGKWNILNVNWLAGFLLSTVVITPSDFFQVMFFVEKSIIPPA